MSNISGLTPINEIEHVDWDNFNPQPEKKGKFTAPPVPVKADGTPIEYIVQFASDMAAKDPSTGLLLRATTTQKGDRKFKLGPLTVVKSQNGSDGYVIRFYDASTKLFTNKAGESLNANMIGKVLRAAGISLKPQTDEAYQQAVGQLAGRTIPVFLDWEARSRDTNFEVRGYASFNVKRTDPNTGVVTQSVQPILRAGDELPDGTVIQEEVLFANAVIRTVLDPNRKTGKASQ